jgi:hypothetical protein
MVSRATRSDPGGLQQGVDTPLDGADLFGNPLFKLPARYHGPNLQAAIEEVELCPWSARKLTLQTLHSLVELVAKILLDQINQGLDLFRL